MKNLWGEILKINYCGVSNKGMEVGFFFQQINRRGVTSIRYPRVDVHTVSEIRSKFS